MSYTDSVIKKREFLTLTNLFTGKGESETGKRACTGTKTTITTREIATRVG